MAALEDAYQDASGIWRGGGWPAVFRLPRRQLAMPGSRLRPARRPPPSAPGSPRSGRPFDTRISIGIDPAGCRGPTLSTWPPARPSSSRATGSTAGTEPATGHRLETPPRGRPRPSDLRPADEISRNWTPGQAKVFARLLVEIRGRAREAGRDARIAQQSIATHLRAAATGRCRSCAHWRVSDDR